MCVCLRVRMHMCVCVLACICCSCHCLATTSGRRAGMRKIFSTTCSERAKQGLGAVGKKKYACVRVRVCVCLCVCACVHVGCWFVCISACICSVCVIVCVHPSVCCVYVFMSFHCCLYFCLCSWTEIISSDQGEGRGACKKKTVPATRLLRHEEDRRDEGKE